MGEIAESLITGDSCEECGIYLGDGEGIPQKCSGCKTFTKSNTKFLYMEELDELKSLGFKVQKFTDYHFRINDSLDVWPSKGKFHFIPDDARGTYNDIFELAEDWLEDEDEDNDSQELDRNVIAVEAMKGIITNSALIINLGKDEIDWVASHSYALADAMIQASKKNI